MKPHLKLGLSDYVLIFLTCLMILFFFDRWSDPVEGWLKAVTRPERQMPEPPRDRRDHRNVPEPEEGH